MQHLAEDVTYLGAILVDHFFAARNPEDTLRASDKQGGGSLHRPGRFSSRPMMSFRVSRSTIR
jgi:hypothetical protein